ncbi:Regulatory protein SdiA [Serratia ficaria]|uniref:autoinducer binding domain-containing protein n=1 Tax=Serratia ficaria TaxID=61651 RepID=UPI0021841893|nr:autoinducer binding domain-containing protein [Serratia ficaria]CAI2495323.1 Regulatory protein SdiA [Serratia ficaria]
MIIDHRQALNAQADNFLAQLEVQTRALGFERFCYIVFSGYPLRHPKMAMESNYPLEFIEDYRHGRYYLRDPVIEQAQRSTLRFAWDHGFYQGNLALWQRMAEQGLAAGWTQSVKDCHGRVGILTLAGSQAPPLESAADMPRQHQFLGLAQAAHQTLREALLPESDEAIKDVLTPREKDVLRWCSEGKTAQEIAIIMSLAERTVNFHIGNAIRKLSVANKTAATAKAVYLQLI